MKNKDYYHVILSAGEPKDIKAKNEKKAITDALNKVLIEEELEKGFSPFLNKAIVIGNEGMHFYFIDKEPKLVKAREFKKKLTFRSQVRYSRLLLRELRTWDSAKWWFPAIEMLIN